MGMTGLPDIANLPLALMQGGDTGIQQLLAFLGNAMNSSTAWGLQQNANQRNEALADNAFPQNTIDQTRNVQNYQQQFTPLMDRTIQGNKDLASGVVGDFRDLRDRSLGYLANSGAQERKDINSQFDAQNAANLGDLTSRGLAGTTLLPGMQSMNQRFRSDALGGLNERLNQQFLGTDMATTGNMANARAQMGQWQQGNEQNLRFGGLADFLNQNQGLAQARLQNAAGANSLYQGNNASLQALLSNTNVNYPDPSLSAQLASSLGAGSGTAAGRMPQNPFWGVFGAQAGGAALNTAGTIGTYGALRSLFPSPVGSM